MSSDNICNIELDKCEKSKKYKRADIDEIARKCGINPNEYKSRKTLCQAIVAKNIKTSGKKEEEPDKSKEEEPDKSKEEEPVRNCNINENECKKSKKYKRTDINDLALKCGIENPKKFKSRNDLCDAILGKETSAKKSGISPNCDKKTLQNCFLSDLRLIAKEENIKNYSNLKKDELVEFIISMFYEFYPFYV